MSDALRGIVERLAAAPGGPGRIIETHISLVLLHGELAFKFKKPVDLGFADFSTLERRHRFCDEELRLNRRLAPELYLDVVPITGTVQAPRLGGEGAAIEYCVRMRRFPQERLLDRQLAAGQLEAGQLEDFAASLAAFHQRAAVAGPHDDHGTAARVRAQVLASVERLVPPVTGPADPRPAQLRRWLERELTRRAPKLRARREAGCVRECHGDLHLSNLVRLDGRVTAFDCIEFNPALRWTDVAAEVAFLCMDLDVRGRADLSARFLNAWLAASGDYDALGLLDLFRVYRSLVRAAVAGIRAAQDAGAQAPDDEGAAARIERHVALASSYVERPRRPWLAITCGLSGAGKSRVARDLAARNAAVHLRSDVERKRLAGLEPGARTDAAPGTGIYAAAMSERTYARLHALARAALAEGFAVVCDATFIERERRLAFRGLAAELGVPFRILAVQAPRAVLEARLRERAGSADPSEADRHVLAQQLARQEPPGADEQALVLTVDTAAGDPDLDGLARALARAAPESARRRQRGAG